LGRFGENSGFGRNKLKVIMKKALIVLLFVFSKTLSAQDLETVKDSLIVKEPFVLNQKAYSITIPDGWRIQENCTNDLCSLLSPRDTLGSYDRFTENINFTVNKLPSPSYTVDKYAQYSITYLPSVVKNFKVIEKKKLRSNAYLLTYKGEKSGFAQTWRQFYYIKNAKVYIMTFACETEKYEFYLPIIDPYLGSFKLK
jgi:hypothetical protein